MPQFSKGGPLRDREQRQMRHAKNAIHEWLADRQAGTRYRHGTMNEGRIARHAHLPKGSRSSAEQRADQEAPLVRLAANVGLVPGRNSSLIRKG